MTTEELRRQSLEQFASLRRQAMFEAQQNAPISVPNTSAAGACSGGGLTFTPFAVQGWAGENNDWSLYRLATDGSKILYEGGPTLTGPAAFTKSTRDDLIYFVSQNSEGSMEFGSWNQETGEVVYFANELVQSVPSSIQFVQGTTEDLDYFIYLDNVWYFGNYEAPSTLYRINLLYDPYPFINYSTIVSYPTINDVGYQPSNIFYNPPVNDQGPNWVTLQNPYGGPGGGVSMNTAVGFEYDYNDNIGPAYIINSPHNMTKVAFLIGGTTYDGNMYFNTFCFDKETGDPFWAIVKFNPEEPLALEFVYEYTWDNNEYISLTTI